MNEKYGITEEELKSNRTNYGRVSSIFELDETGTNKFCTRIGHFNFKFNNGYEISIFNGAGSYTDNHNVSEYDIDEMIFSDYIELAIIKDGYFHTRDFIKDIDDDVVGFVDVSKLIEVINLVKNKE